MADENANIIPVTPKAIQMTPDSICLISEFIKDMIHLVAFFLKYKKYLLKRMKLG